MSVDESRTRVSSALSESVNERTWRHSRPMIVTELGHTDKVPVMQTAARLECN